MAAPNIYAPEFEHESDRPGFAYRDAWIAHHAGCDRLGAGLYELDPGSATFAYHWHSANEEMLLVLSGTVTLRTPEGERVLAAGDVVCFRTGPEGAHTVRNDSDAPTRVLMMSCGTRPEIVVYPDSDKIGTRPGRGEQDNFNFRRDSGLEYWDGEE